MTETITPTNDPPLSVRSNGKQMEQPDPFQILQDILDTMHGSDFFPRPGKDTPSQFWSAYERVAKQHDDEFLERQNNDMDVLLIFAGLFSAVNSAFIVSMAASLSPNPSDKTNTLLMILINKVDNGTFPQEDVSLPVWEGPSSTNIWIQTLAYMSLSTSLIAAFGAVLCKQWLGYYKTSRFGRGSLAERCQRRQQKLDSLETWKLKGIIAALPIFLQLSLLFFGIALSANIWTQQHTVASVIIGTTGLGAVFYTFTVVASLSSPHCPFQTPLSTVLKRFSRDAWNVLKAIRPVMSNVLAQCRRYVSLMASRESWKGFLSRLRRSWRGAFRSCQRIVVRSASGLLPYPSESHPSGDPESVIVLETSTASRELDFRILDTSPKHIGVRLIQWILETSTDNDMTTTAVMMVPEVEWPNQYDVTDVLDRLRSQLYACFDPSRQLLPLAETRAAGCLKAIYHLSFERDLDNPLFIGYSGIWDGDDFLYQIPRDCQGQAFDVIFCVQNRRMQTGRRPEVDITSLSPSDRMWMAHMFTFRLFKRDYDPFVIDFVKTCLLDPASPGRLVADCLISAGLLIGLPIPRQHLARLDKSAFIPDLRKSVIRRLQDVPLTATEDIVEQKHILNARKILSSFQHLGGASDAVGGYDECMSIECLETSFRLLEEPADQSNDDVAAMLRLSIFYSTHNIWSYLYQEGPRTRTSYWLGAPYWHTPTQFDLLVDYLMRVCEETDYVAIEDAFVVLAGLRGSSRIPDTYIDTTIRFMGPAIPLRVRHAAINASSVVQAEVASLGRDNGSLRYRFSHAVTSAVLNDTGEEASSRLDNPFRDLSFFNLWRDACYLQLLCTLAKEPAWHGQLQRDGHFDNCLAITDTLSQDTEFYLSHEYAVFVMHVSSVVDALGQECQFLQAVQAYPSWPLVITAWYYIFRFDFFTTATRENYNYVSSTGHLEALPSLVAYAKRYQNRWDNSEFAQKLTQLIEQVCDKLDEEQGRSEHEGDVSFGHQGIPALSKQINVMMYGDLRCQ